MASSSSNQMIIHPAQDSGLEDFRADFFMDIKDRSLKSRCPPIVTTDTIIIAVCGANDYMNNAAPGRDGRFFSDFYLFHHLLRGTAEQQTWLTCVDPKYLINKYGEYAHGDQHPGERRIVLGERMLDELRDVNVVESKNESDLLDTFLSHVQDASKQVKNTNQPILILIFGHGTHGIFSINIGGTGEFHECPVLTQAKFTEALRYNSNLNSAFMTSYCYGGSWVQTSFLNITAMAGVDDEDMLLSYPRGLDPRRCCGSIHASGVARALLETMIEGLTSDEMEDICETSTFAALRDYIKEELRKEVDVHQGDSISFSAEDDHWNMQWRARTGFPLHSYQQKWEPLRLLETEESTGYSQAMLMSGS